MNKMKTLFITLLCMGAGTLSAQTADSTQTSPWTKEGFAGLKLTQVSLTNWAAGGDNSVAFDLQGTYQINYKKGSKHPIKYPFSLLYFHCTFAFAILHELLTYFHYDTRTI